MKFAKLGISVLLLAACSEAPRKVELVQVGDDKDWAHVSAGAYDICATKVDGSAHCFSSTRHWTEYDPGLQFLSKPERLNFDYDVADFSLGPQHSCLVAANFRLYCWGTNEYGQLGIGEPPTGLDYEPGFKELPARVGGKGKWLAVAAGLRHTCGLKSDHTLWCWGDRVTAETVTYQEPPTDGTDPSYNEWADSLRYAFITTEPTLIDDRHIWTSVFARDDITCALDEHGVLYCAHLEEHEDGANFDYERLDEKAEGLRFRRVTQEVPWAQVSIGAHFSCGIGEDQTLWCWETLLQSEGYFRMQIEMPTPERFGRSAHWAHVSAGSEDVCALTTKGKIWCYTGGKQTDEEGREFIYWLPVARKSTWKDVSVGGTQSCAVKDDGTLWCWKTFCSRENNDRLCK